MADEDQDEAAAVAQVIQQVHDRGGRNGIEGGGDFVADQHVGVRRERAGDGDALALAAGEFVGVAVGEASGEADLFEEFQDAGRGLVGGGAPVQTQRTAEGRADRAARVEGAQRVLGHELEASALFAGAALGGGGETYSVEGDGTAGGAVESDDGADQGRLARAGGSDDARTGAGGHGEADVVKDGGAAAASSEGRVQTGDGERGCAGGERPVGGVWQGWRCGRAAGEVHDVVGQPGDQVRVVAGQCDGELVTVREVAQEFGDLVAQLRVETGGRLVEEQCGGTAGQCPGEGDAALLATGERSWAAPQETSLSGELDLGDQVAQCLRAAVRGDFGEEAADRHPGIET